MKLKLIKYRPKKTKGLACLNCGQPLLNNENFCSYCGQKNNTKQLNFSNFLSNLFSGLFSYDSRFWTTFIPLLTKPGKVSKQYIEGKRARFVNPFQLYLNVSIIFFLLIGISNKFNLNKTEKNTGDLVKLDSIINRNDINKDSLTANFKEQLLKNIPVDSSKTEDIQKINDAFNIIVEQKKKESDSVSTKNSNNKISGVLSKIQLIINLYKKHPNYSKSQTLDSLKLLHTFWNNFYYQQITNGYKNYEQIKLDGGKSYIQKLTSTISISLFFFLPFFALFLKLIYFRRNYTYMEHLVFVFNTQTIFFLLFIIFYSANLIGKTDTFSIIFSLVFLWYLYKSFRNFYQQSRFKTILKLIILNFFYFLSSIVGLILVAAFSFFMA